ncbi:MAG: agmatine deiminase family protein [Deltaproteobacteria bacterium]|nr:agmatine deiminase family protein [Deltaproteobacteria bacterium]
MKRNTKKSISAVRMPAEWEPHEATWLGFPANPDDWPGKLPAVEWVYGEIIRQLVRGEKIYLLAQDAKHEAHTRAVLEKVGVPKKQLRVMRIRTDRNWMRDSGPIAVKTGKKRHIAGFRFNAWAKYDNWKRDIHTASEAAANVRIPYQPVLHNGKPVVLEGGAIDVNGCGTLLTTRECLLHPKKQVRNPGFGSADYEAVFAQALGIRNTIWLQDGIAGDDTHGHVDDLARFVNPNTVVLCHETNVRDPNHLPLKKNLEILQGSRLEDGARVEVVLLPMPEPLVFDGVRVPASYANFYVGNEVVLVPTFNDEMDRVALGILAELFPTRRVVGIHAVDLVWGFGTLHCLTQQLPV